MRVWIGLVAVALAARFAIGQSATYLVIGDSLARGFRSTEVTFRGPGDEGYAGLFAGHLAGVSGERPRVVNLARVGEDTSSYFGDNVVGSILNSNYPVGGGPSQASLVAGTIAAEGAAGRSITHVTVQLGVNDLLGLLTPSLLDLPAGEQLMAVRAEIDELSASLGGILDGLRSALPDARIDVIGYYNPFALFLDRPELDPSADGFGAAVAPLSTLATPELNAALAGLAADAGANFVDVAPLFAGRESELTLITTLDLVGLGDGGEPIFGPNIHPTLEGYEVIADAIIAVPGAGTGLIVSSATLIGIGRRRARR